MANNNSYNNVPPPNENIDPKLKQQLPFLLQKCKSVWSSNQMGSFQKIFYRNQAQYEENMDYALGMQSNAKYKPLMGVDQADNKTWLNIDWNIRKIIPKFRDIAISKMCKVKYTTQCTPIDPLAKDEIDNYFNGLKTKIAMREVLQKVGSPLQNAPAVKPEEGEPQDYEELKMQMDFGAKTNLAMEAELGIEVVFNENNVDDQEKQIVTNMFDWGVGIYKDYIDENMRVRTRVVDPRYFGTNYCRKRDFSDMTLAWEIIDVDVNDLAVIFPDQSDIDLIKEIAKSRMYDATGGTVGTRSWVSGFDPTKARVMDLEFWSTDMEVTEMNINKKGNPVMVKADYQYRNNQKTVTMNGKEVAKYNKKRVKNLYVCKWVIGTDLCYDYGLAKNMKRSTDPRKASEVNMSFHVYAPNFHEMKAASKLQALIPLADEYQLTIYRIQQFKNTWIPYVIDIDLDAIEDVALGAGGEKMKPSEVLKMMFEQFTLVSRKKDLGGATGNVKSVNIQSTDMASQFTVLSGDLDRIVNQIRDIAGFNEVTDGSTPNAKNLNSTNEAAMEGTNNALWPITDGARRLRESLANGVFERLQVVVAMQGNYSGYYTSLGSNSMKFFQVSKNICLHYYGIKLEERVTDEQKQFLLEYFKIDIQNQLLSTADVYMVISMYNTKQAWQYLNYRVEANKKKMQDQANQNQQMTGQVQMQSAQAAEQAKQQTQAQKDAAALVYLDREKAWDYTIAIVQSEKQTDQVVLQEALRILGKVGVNEMGQPQGGPAQLPTPDMNAAAPQQPAQPQSPQEEQQEPVDNQQEEVQEPVMAQQ